MSDPRETTEGPDDASDGTEQVNDVVADNDAEQETVDLLDPENPPA
ncbi:hypothetical protein MN032_07910 [Agromyces atrinae]|uniref:Uncharacterized protein n=1 Tax=Agromyces atrinae TaxID=592376 RepID=A0A852S150_9MICO|nr:hypothetical protein [Agromyces atrinae]MCI2957613.1 hypothetical protein [Agromyces atrinae]NYD67078.1 hypothetical protein [Agromyces atrinae]